MQPHPSCVLLLRGSSQTLSKHEAACRAFAEEKGLDVLTVFREREVLPLQRRKVLRWLRAFCRNNSQAKFVVAYKERSISLNASELFLVGQFLQKIGVTFLFVKETAHPDF